MRLAVVESCTSVGCRVRFVKSDQVVETRYSGPVLKHHIQIRPGELVAVDTGKETPETVWRWVRTTVHQVEGSRVLVGADVASVSSVPLIQGLAGDVAAGDDVWVCGTPAGPEVHDRVVDGGPANAERLEKHAFPMIEATYAQMIDE